MFRKKKRCIVFIHILKLMFPINQKTRKCILKFNSDMYPFNVHARNKLAIFECASNSHTCSLCLHTWNAETKIQGFDGKKNGFIF